MNSFEKVFFSTIGAAVVFVAIIIAYALWGVFALFMLLPIIVFVVFFITFTIIERLRYE